MKLPWLDDLVRNHGAERLPAVLSRKKMSAVLSEMHRVTRLMATTSTAPVLFLVAAGRAA